MASKTITLVSSDQRHFPVVKEVGDMFQDFAINSEDNQLVIPLNFVTGDVLEKVLEWANHHIWQQKDGNVNDAINQTSGMSNWEERYLSNVLKVMRDVAKASFILDIKGLQDLFFRFVFNWLRGKMHVHVPDVLMFKLGCYLKSTELALRRQ